MRRYSHTACIGVTVLENQPALAQASEMATDPNGYKTMTGSDDADACGATSV